MTHLLNEGNCFNLQRDKKRLDAIIDQNPTFYRYVPIHRMLELLRKQQIAFVNPKKWSDPFDNFLFRALDKSEARDSFLDALYVLCFTLNPHSQAYWQNYSTDGWAARLEIRTREFFQCLLQSTDDIWLGRIKYIAESELRARLRSKKGLKASLLEKAPNRTFIDFFHLKRWPFKYEEEVRVMIHSTKLKEGIKKLDIEPSKVINSIRLDPRMSSEEAIVYKDYLKKFSIELTKSQLFTKRAIKIQ